MLTKEEMLVANCSPTQRTALRTGKQSRQERAGTSDFQKWLEMLSAALPAPDDSGLPKASQVKHCLLFSPDAVLTTTHPFSKLPFACLVFLPPFYTSPWGSLNPSSLFLHHWSRGGKNSGYKIMGSIHQTLSTALMALSTPPPLQRIRLWFTSLEGGFRCLSQHKLQHWPRLDTGTAKVVPGQSGSTSAHRLHH